MKKIISMLMVIALSLTCFACGPQKPNNNGGGDNGGDGNKGTDIVIYAGGSSEFSWTAGQNESEVIDYIEDKYYQDTGIKLNFKTNLTLGKSMKDNIINDVREGDVDIVISHTSGGDGIDDWALKEDVYYDLSDYVDDYFYDYIEEGKFSWTDGELTIDAITRLTNEEKEIIGIPSVINPYKFGILVRKDWMEQAGYTDDINDKSRTYVGDFETFTEMAKAMKVQQNLDYVITGALFDVEKAGLLGACGINAGYYTNTVYTEGDKTYVGPGYIHPNYVDVMKMEYEWSRDGLLAADPDNIYLSAGETNFISEKTGIFLQDPTITHLIEVARKAKKYNPNAEFTVLGALTKDKNSTEKGFMRNSIATFGAMVNKSSRNAKDIMKFMKWVYSSEENYLLCKYGREGIDWIYDRENNTYEYKVGDYTNPPYSGILALVENQAMANLDYAGYTEEEKQWIETARNKDNYIKNDTIDYLLHTNNAELINLKGNQAVIISTTIRPIWNGHDNYMVKDGETLTSVIDYNKIESDFELARQKYITNANAYISAMYTIYNNLK